MNDTLFDFKITDRQTFIQFLDLLRKDFLDNPESWENKTLPYFLEALSAYTKDIQGYYDNMKLNVNADEPNWSTFADILKVRKFTNSMWSDRYNYYNIQFDEQFGQKLDKSFVIKCLLETNLFKQTNHQTFTNFKEFPWVDIVLVETYDGNFATSDKENQFVTLVAIVCSKRQDIDQKIYINTFKQIANRLNWKLYLEEDDEGNENVEL